MKIKFSIGPGEKSGVEGQTINSNFFYISTTENGIASSDGVVNDPTNPPVKIESGNVESVLRNNLNTVLGLFNFENVFDSKKNPIATAAAQGISNIGQSLYSISVYKK